MRFEPAMQQRMSMKQILAPRMIQSMEILQLPTVELAEHIEQEWIENPVLGITIDGGSSGPPPPFHESLSSPDMRPVVLPVPGAHPAFRISITTTLNRCLIFYLNQ